MNEEHTVAEVIQALKNQRFWPNQATLDEDLQNAIEAMEWMSDELIVHLQFVNNLLSHIERTHGTENE